jgi:hypothetical protein
MAVSISVTSAVAALAHLVAERSCWIRLLRSQHLVVDQAHVTELEQPRLFLLEAFKLLLGSSEQRTLEVVLMLPRAITALSPRLEHLLDPRERRIVDQRRVQSVRILAPLSVPTPM